MTPTPLLSAPLRLSPSACRARTKRVGCCYLLVMVLGAPAIANATPSTAPAAPSLVSIEDDDGYLRRDDRQSVRKRNRRAPVDAERTAPQVDTEPLGVGGVLLVGASVFLTAGAVVLPATVLAAACLALPIVGIVLAIGCLAVGVGLPAMAGSSVAEALGADGSSVKLGAAVGAGIGLAGGLALGAASVVAGFGGLVGFLLLAEARGANTGQALGIVLVPMVGLGLSAALTVFGVGAFSTVGATIGALNGGMQQMGTSDAASGE